ncbi:MAG: DNA recombination protein RmuC [Deltaproteobacteria bacterium]|nr:DNA recombination protein RmuC [Deltaproteobacteria bacterium]
MMGTGASLEKLLVKASPYVIFLLAVLLALFLLIITIFLIRKLLEKKKSDEEVLTQFQLLQGIQREMGEFRLSHEEEAKKAYSEMIDAFVKTQETLKGGLDSGMKSIMENLSSLSGAMTEQLSRSQTVLNEQLGIAQKNISEQLTGTVKIIGDVRTTLGGLSESAKRMQELGENISELQKIMKSPKLRGNIGEVLLEDMLKQVIPTENYQLQYQFRGGEMVDAVIRVGGSLIPVDAKFPLESFSRLMASPDEVTKKREMREFITSVRRKIDDIASKYIRPEEGTYDFALMYIPAENVYYEIIVSDREFSGGIDLYNYALKRKVVLVSPNSFYAYLVAIAFGLKGFTIEKEAYEIRGRLEELYRIIERFGDAFEGLGKNLNISVRKYEEARKNLETLETRLDLITGIKGEIAGKEQE